jgi:hypothetical protein
LGIASDEAVTERYIKPHGLRLRDGRIVCWGRARDWKTILLAIYERASFAPNGSPSGAVLLFPSGRSAEEYYQKLIYDVARRLSIEQVVWYDA